MNAEWENKISGFKARKKGRDNETRLLTSILSRKKLWPKYIVSVRRASKSEDREGKDLIVRVNYTTESESESKSESKSESALGSIEIGIQVKSSRWGVKKHKKKHKDIPVIIVENGIKESILFLRFIDIVKGQISKIREEK